jgi:hypothetical protein
MRGRSGRKIVASIQLPCTLTATLTGWMLQEPTQHLVGDGLAYGQHHVVDNLAPGWRPAAAASWSKAHPSPAGQLGDAAQAYVQLSPAAGVTAVIARWVLQARVIQLRHRTSMGAAWRQPSRSPRQSPPAVPVTVAPFSGRAAPHRPPGPPQPVQLRRQRPGAVLQILQVAVAVERPAVDTTCPAAPVAGLRSARTGVVGLRPARAAAALVDPRAGHDGDLPGPTGLPAPHEASPPLALVASPDNPPSRRARPSRSRIAGPPYSRPVRRAGHGLVRPMTQRQQPTRPAPWRSRSPVSCAARIGLARRTKQVIDGPLGGRSRARVACNGLCGDLEQHVHDQQR